MDNKTLPPCPHCGSTTEGFMVRGQMRGPVIHYYDSKGQYEEMYTDRTYTTSSGTIRCAACSKIRHDVDFVYSHYFGKEIIQSENKNKSRDE